jgi:hypothetical protein
VSTRSKRWTGHDEDVMLSQEYGDEVDKDKYDGIIITIIIYIIITIIIINIIIIIIIIIIMIIINIVLIYNIVMSSS